ncbi:hypothetical protein BP5796_04307 [Coleophoma crateriformis]|uniref:NACHT domain-containing protein n=1 Tax=Coleophoma crateriformis TaxID=565419 RepID=A0A3D8SI78_9HELO|nr:hypothetical protein BP5796_04307 [Coleophoma crateriformis]
MAFSRIKKTFSKLIKKLKNQRKQDEAQTEPDGSSRSDGPSFPISGDSEDSGGGHLIERGPVSERTEGGIASLPENDRLLKNDEPTGELLNLAFELFLSALAESDAIKNSPTSVFLVYAHDNKNLSPKREADAEKAQKIIEWLKSLRSKIRSDRSPLIRDSLSIRGTDESGAHNILSNQLCLLPNSGNVSSSVDKVILCSSELLQSYQEDSIMRKYIEDIKDFYKSKNDHENYAGKAYNDLEIGLRRIAARYIGLPSVRPAGTAPPPAHTDNGFHHVVTEMAFIQIRAECDSKLRDSIIPVILNGPTDQFDKLQIYIPLAASSEEWVFHEAQILHEAFFKILKRVFVDLTSAIDEFKHHYLKCIDALRKEASSSSISKQNFTTTVQTEIGNALDKVIRDKLATYRSILGGYDLHRFAASLRPLLDRCEIDLNDAHNALKEYYDKPNRLTIERISGEPLPMDHCYINLAIVERNNNEIFVQQSSAFSRLDRFETDEVSKGARVSLPELFSPRKDPGGRTISPKRILIRGDAGVGKTTLCKKIVYDYINNKIWPNLFGCILWVSLRRLKGKGEKPYKLLDLIHDIYFPEKWNGEALASTLANSIESSDPSTKSSTTLFLLDGLDEVSSEVNSDNAIGAFLRYLLQMPNVIITSRPHRLDKSKIGSLDLDLETTGFRQEQVEAYIENSQIVNDADKAREIKIFLKSNPLMQGLVRIPIQLDALCFSWSPVNYSKSNLKTMTNIYKAIEWKLWQKDISTLNKVSQNGRPLDETAVKDSRPSEIDREVTEEKNLLGGLAFIGLYNNIIEFDDKNRDQICVNLSDQHLKLPPVCNDVLKRSSFLRTADKTLPDMQQSYHFLHLTFQEYFAARYFVNCWAEESDLQYLSLNSADEPSSLSPQDFLRREKYNSRYNIFWRFVTGLIQAHRKLRLLNFFQLLEDTPQDLLGPAHQRLIMTSLCEIDMSNSETSLSDFKAFREIVDNRLYEWLLFEIKFQNQLSSFYTSNVPEYLLGRLLGDPDNQAKVSALTILRGNPKYFLARGAEDSFTSSASLSS